MHPLITSQVAAARHQELLAQAAQRRLARQAITQARALRRAQRSERRAQRAARLVLRPRAGLEQ
jgi:hypothetical protein